MSPALHPQRYSTSFNYPQPALLTSSAPLQHSYDAQAYYNDQYPSNSLGNRSPPNQTQFIPTPSDMASSYPNYPQTLPPYSPTAATYGPRVDVYSKPVTGPPQRPRTSRISIGRARTASGATLPPTSATSPSGERFPCEDCGKTFSRSHDRKRHQETLHLPNSVSHRCRYCEKEFSRWVLLCWIIIRRNYWLYSVRADSLKRHLDNGCDEMPRWLSHSSFLIFLRALL